jgi:hypothetical protein
MGSSLIGRMIADLLRVIASVLVVIRVVWILQGVNILPGSFMTGHIEWAYRGAIALVVGLALLAAVNWRRS